MRPVQGRDGSQAQQQTIRFFENGLIYNADIALRVKAGAAGFRSRRKPDGLRVSRRHDSDLHRKDVENP
jgi:hypothetical protein